MYHLKEPWPEAAVQKDVKPKYLKEATCVVVGSDPRAAGLVGMDHLWVHTQEGLGDHILQRGGGAKKVRGWFQQCMSATHCNVFPHFHTVMAVLLQPLVEPHQSATGGWQGDVHVCVCVLPYICPLWARRLEGEKKCVCAHRLLPWSMLSPLAKVLLCLLIE